jgi:hypothetical protein
VTHHFTPETENVDFNEVTKHFVIKSSQTSQLYITKVFDKQFSCHDYITNHFS